MKTSRGGSIQVKLTEKDVSDDMTELTFSVSDTGCGMSDNLKKRLLSKSEQENTATVREHGGSGLGLCISKELVTLMNGTITVLRVTVKELLLK